MIPFNDHKKVGTIMMARRKAEGGLEEAPNDSMLIAEELIHAVHSKDVNAVAEALEAAFVHFSNEPHEQGETIEEGTI